MQATLESVAARLKPSLIDIYALDYADLAVGSGGGDARRTGMTILSKLRESQEKLQLVAELFASSSIECMDISKFSIAAERVMAAMTQGKTIVEPVVRSYWAKLTKSKFDSGAYGGCIDRSSSLLRRGRPIQLVTPDSREASGFLLGCLLRQ